MCHFRFDPEPWQRRAAIHAARQPVSPAILPFSLSASHLSSDAAAAADAAFEGQCGAHLGKISNWVVRNSSLKSLNTLIYYLLPIKDIIIKSTLDHFLGS